MLGYFQKKEKNEIPVRELDPREESPAARFLFVTGENFFRLLWANLLFLVFSLPVFTIPAAYSGLHKVIRQFYRNGSGDVWPTFFAEFRSDFIEKLVAGFLPAAGTAAVGLLLNRLAGTLPPLLCYSIAGAFVAVSLSVYGWFFPETAFLQLTPLPALRNAFLLSALEPGKSLLLILSQAAYITVFCFFWPFSVPFLVIAGPVIPAVLTEMITNAVMEERLVNKN